MSIITRDLYIGSQQDARDFLKSAGMHESDFDEFAELLLIDDYELLSGCYSSLKEEFHCYELALDAAQGVLNDVMNLCDELKRRARTKEARAALDDVYNLVYNSEAV